MPWNRGANAVASFIALDREGNHILRSYLECVGKMDQLEAEVEGDPVYKDDVIAALTGTGKTILDIAGEIDNHGNTRIYVETNHPNVGG